LVEWKYENNKAKQRGQSAPVGDFLPRLIGFLSDKLFECLTQCQGKHDDECVLKKSYDIHDILGVIHPGPLEIVLRRGTGNPEKTLLSSVPVAAGGPSGAPWQVDAGAGVETMLR
jgi:hypothetical protein